MLKFPCNNDKDFRVIMGLKLRIIINYIMKEIIQRYLYLFTLNVIIILV